MTNPKISIIIVTSQRYNDLERLLISIREQQYVDLEIIVVCMEIDEKLSELAIKYSADLYEDSGKGICYARNLGFSKSKGEIIVYFDDDVTLPTNYLVIVEKYLDIPGVSGFGGNPIIVDENGIPKKRGLITKIIDKIIWKISQVDMGTVYTESPIFVDALWGSNMAFKRKAIMDTGKFDESFYHPNLGEETDFTLRVTQRGHRLVFDPNICVLHFTNFTNRGLKRGQYEKLLFGMGDNASYWRVKNQRCGNLWLVYQIFVGLSWSIKTRNPRCLPSLFRGIRRGRYRGRKALNASV